VDRKGLAEPVDGPGWRDAKADEDVFAQTSGFYWFRASLPALEARGRVLRFTAVDDKATVFLNGKELLHHEGWNESFDVPVDRAWREGGPNELAVLVENNYGGGYVKNVTLLYPGVRPSGPALPSFDDSSWSTVHLPHDFVVEGTFDREADGSHGFLPKGVGWYRKVFDLPATDRGRSLWIDFDGVYRDSTVWLNGKELGRHLSGYTSFRYDITDAVVHGGRNTLVVRADARNTEGWWYEGGGIYRHVWLNRADPLHVEPWGVFVASHPKGVSGALEVRTSVANRGGKDAACRIVHEVLDATGAAVLEMSGPLTVKGGDTLEVLHRSEIPQVRPWSPEDPYLYTLVTRLESEGGAADRVETPFGVREVRFDPAKGFFLNGRPYRLKGTCNHQDHAGVGVAIPDRLFEYRIRRLKSMGSNAYRCAHNPPAPELLDVCDRMGVLVIDENRRLGDSPEVLSQLESMVKRDRNHPSVILWSLCNEETLQGKPEGRRRGEAMKDLVLRLDPTRLVTAAMNYGFGEGLSEVVDVQGFNYNPGQYDDFHRKFPDKPCYGSETASTVCTRGVYENDPERGTVSAYDVNHTQWSQVAEEAWKAIDDREWMAGCFVWTGFDYRGEPTPYSWPCINSHFGILDTCGFPKDNYWYYKARWGKDPVLHLLPHWNWKGREGREIDVWAQTNCDEVELFLNGKSQGSRKLERNGHLEWKVRYEPGTLTARGKRDGRVLEEKVETTGAPAALRLSAYATRLLADGQDITPVDVSVVDSKGRVVPTASNPVRFKWLGPARIAGVGNGDPSSHEPDKASRRRAFHGRCQVLLQANDRAGRVVLTALSEGLRPASVTIRTSLPAAR
jgi:beta-galactosidase